MHKDLADKIGMAFFYAGKSPNDLLDYWGGDRRDSNFRRALGVYEQVKRRSDGEDVVEDRSSEEHAAEANRLEALARDEKDPKARKELEDRMAFHRNEVGLDNVIARMRADSDSQNYAIDKIAENLAELKRKADKVFGRIGDSEEPGECGLEEPGKVP
jgi:hypothetical protein